MAILQSTTSVTGLVGVAPRLVFIATNDTEAAITTTGYLNSEQAVNQGFADGDMALVTTKTSPSATDVSTGWFQINYASGNWSLAPTSSPGDVVLPTIANHLAVFTNTTGTLSEDVSTAINAGNIQAGVSGTAGALISYPTTAAKGSLQLVAVANSGNTVTTISNAAMGQASIITIPDVGAATGQFVAKTAAFVSGNFPQNSGTAGLVIDSGLAVSNIVSKIAANTFSGSGQIILAKANGTEATNAVTASGNAGVITTSSLSAAGGATYVITWTNTKITATSVFAFCIQGGTNTTQNITFTCVPGAGSATLTIYNNTAATALNGTILIGYTVL